jgi:hypothetical protein
MRTKVEPTPILIAAQYLIWFETDSASHFDQICLLPAAHQFTLPWDFYISIFFAKKK